MAKNTFDWLMTYFILYVWQDMTKDLQTPDLPFSFWMAYIQAKGPLPSLPLLHPMFVFSVFYCFTQSFVLASFYF